MSICTITGIHARQIYDSRGNPAVEVDVTTQQGQFRACVPSGASTGVHEAVELRDGKLDNNDNVSEEMQKAHHGKGVLTAVQNVNTTLADLLRGMDPRQQREIDLKMIEKDNETTPKRKDGTKGGLGANAILGVSMAVARAGAAANGLPLYQHIANLAGNPQVVLPVPAFNIINGGSHAGNPLWVQEYMVLPVGASSFEEAMRIGSEIYHHLKKVIKKDYGPDAVNVGDEGGFAPNIQDMDECWRVIQQAVRTWAEDIPNASSLQPAQLQERVEARLAKVQFGMDVAASEFYDKENQVYNLNKFEAEEKNDANNIDAGALGDMYIALLDQGVPLCSIEDGFDEDDWDGWRQFKLKLQEQGKELQLVGDDLLVTNVQRIEMAHHGDGDAPEACNALLLKLNQIGSLTEAIDAVKMAKGHGWGVMTSHRSGETEDPFIADLAVGLSTGQIKSGAPCRSERLAKYNQLLRIEEELKAGGGDGPIYAGQEFRRPTAWLMEEQEV